MKLVHGMRELLERRRELRKNQTPAESLLWNELRGNKLGLKFRRQYSIGGYILDFYCPSKRLIIEIDGSAHDNRKIYDKQRDKYFEELNYKVLRFKNTEVEGNMRSVLGAIRNTLS